ncbi:hypothetical protein [Sphingobacterium endophyticum]|uniref:hypothetical protein n=1 Tax=Sphingobacterium endophyticum TaxID=2546448 RepID=UPI0018CD5C35|nr:hypothetical protein [Sphingobacterium endophyticum]
MLISEKNMLSNYKEKQFWNWFERNNSKFFFLNQIDNEQERERLLDDFLERLHTYNEHLFFEIGGHPDETQELIITAEGDTEYFEKVEALVKEAPSLKNWHIIPFKPPAEGFTISYKGIELDPKNLWFFPLENKQNISLLGLKIYLPRYEHSQKKDTLTAVYLVLDSLLGERSSSMDIHHVEVHQLPSNPEEQGLLDLVDLPGYIKWKKSKS